MSLTTTAQLVHSDGLTGGRVHDTGAKAEVSLVRPHTYADRLGGSNGDGSQRGTVNGHDSCPCDIRKSP
jgi:hypothetical protein